MRLAALWIATGALALADLAGVFSGALDHPAIEYSTRPVDDPAARLNRRLDHGLTLAFEPEHGYLRALLDALGIPVESQIATFAKASFQQHLIHPRNARALYFNDAVAVGWVRSGAMLEIASEDPRQGTIFYTLNQQPGVKPRLVRHDDCLTCHESYDTLGVPGMLLRSVYPARDGYILRELGSSNIDHRSPFERRWGGWFVTGTKDLPRSLANTSFRTETETAALQPELNGYLAPGSDIAALMVFDHQMHLMNLLTRVGWETRFDAYEKSLTPEKLAQMAAEVTDYMLFVDEARLEPRVQGTSRFQEAFAALGPFDGQGRSLRQFDLQHRMMKYPCSYMIYSAAFDALPTQVKESIYQRMWAILSGGERGEKYARLSAEDRRAIAEILRATKNGLPDYFL
ncbi:MAG TPA: hypothetical protein VMT15_03220 [Bryobacteraceae bacterium]|nr:hypothetical protein [Bryobacteraceae bacterium]